MTDEDRENIKSLFDFYVPGIPKCGDVVFDCSNFNLLNEKFNDIEDTQQKQKFVDLFFELNIVKLEKEEWVGKKKQDDAPGSNLRASTIMDEEKWKKVWFLGIF